MQYTINVNDKKTKVKSFLRHSIILASLLGVGFFSGLYVASKSEVAQSVGKKEVVYLGKLSGKYSVPAKDQLNEDLDFKLFWDLWDLLKKDYVDQADLTDKKMFYGAMRGMVASVGDPYTIFMEPQIAKDFNEDLAGKFEGIGAEIGLKDDLITVIAPLDEMPAQLAGIKAGDKIIAINSEITNGMSINDAVKKIRGAKGTKVTLTIARIGLSTTKDIIITRGTITVKSIKTEFLVKDNIYKIKITNFNNDTKELMDKAITDILVKKPSGIIVDLRNNPGGYLETAIELSSEWVDSAIVVSEKSGKGEKEDFYSRGTPRLKGYKTVILVNEGSASASEILSGALHDHKLATLVGKKTYGKGSVQTLEHLEDQSQLKVTVAKWLTPNGININKDGIKPDIEVEYTPEDFKKEVDPQLNKAIDVLKGKVDLKKIELENLAKEKAAAASSTNATSTATSTKEIKK
ncbi:MAG: S41 family peptidase [Candidatus Falkowbacteria bacterium]|nr:S41 family peptidase [Candidatus Falkowbacteria bacterium]